MEPIRVLHILHSMNRGGAENAIMNYYRHIDRNKVQFDFLLTEHKRCQFEDEILSLGGRVFRVPVLTMKNPFPYLTGVWRFYKSHSEYRIVHSHTSSKSFFPLFLAKKTGIPVRISHSHNTRSEAGLSGFLRDCLKLPLKKVATHFCACGEEAAIWLYGQKFFNAVKVRIVPNVIEAEDFCYSIERRREIRNMLGFPDSAVVLGCTARFSPQKNHRFLLSVFYEFNKIIGDSVMLLLGGGELKSEIESQVKELGLEDRVYFIGTVANVSDYEQAMDFFLLPSINEGIPLSLIEAQVSGLRCFVSEGVPRESDKTGLVSFLSLDEGPEYWARQIADSIEYHRNSHLDDIVKAGYDAPTSAQKLEQFYLETFNNLGYEN